MNLDFGEYLLVSACLNTPYDYRKVEAFLESLDMMNFEYLEADFIEIKPDKASYDLIFNETFQIMTFRKFEVSALREYLVSSLDFMLIDKIRMRLQVTFLDELSYEICMIFNHDELTGEAISEERVANNLKFIEELALKYFEIINPLYGIIAVENSVTGLLLAAQDDYYLPVDKVFYNNSLVADEDDVWSEYIHSSIFVKKLRNGIYLRKAKIGGFSIEAAGDNTDLQKLVKARLNRMIESR